MDGEPLAIAPFQFDGDHTPDLMIGLTAGIVPLRGWGDGTFEPKAVIPGSQNCSGSILAADFNGDGQEDLLNNCGVLFNQGNGTFRMAPFPDPQWFGGVVMAADLNGDGILDAAMGSYLGDLRIFFGQGNGQFHPPATVWPALGITILTRDLDRDGRTDLATIAGHTVCIFWGQPGPRYLPSAVGISGFGFTRTLAVADLDRNGTPDLLFPHAPGSHTDLYLNPGSATRRQPTRRLNTRNPYSFMEPGDLDGDDTVDLAGAASPGAALVTLLDRAGRIKSEASMPAGSPVSGIAVARIDGDATPDLVLPCQATGEVAVFLGLGGGAFGEARRFPAVPRPTDLAVRDLDLDGGSDLAVIAPTAVAVLHGDGRGGFSEPAVLAQFPAAYYTDVAIEEVTADSWPDLLVSSNAERSSIDIYPGMAGRQFERPQALKLNVRPSALLLSDLDRNGLTDIIAASTAHRTVSVIMRSSANGFAEPVDYFLAFPPIDQRLADFDQDGALDLAVLSSSGTEAMIILGRAAPASEILFRRGDVDQDGRVQVTDPIRLLDRLFLGGEPLSCEDAADSNDDGALNVTDAITLIERLFLGGPPLPPPGPIGCGEDPGADTLAECHESC